MTNLSNPFDHQTDSIPGTGFSQVFEHTTSSQDVEPVAPLRRVDDEAYYKPMVEGFDEAILSTLLRTTQGVVSLWEDDNTTLITIGGGASQSTIRIGKSGAAFDLDSGAGTWDSSAGISLDAAAASNFTVTGSSQDLTLSSSGGSVIVQATEAIADAIRIYASDAAGGVDIDSGTGGFSVVTAGQSLLQTSYAAANAIRIYANSSSGGIDVDAGTSGFDLDTTGRIELTSSQAAANAFIINASDAAGGIDVDAGAQINLDSSQAAVDAIRIYASNASGGIDIDSGTQGINIGSTGSIKLISSVAATDAIRFYASHSGGGIDIDSGSNGIDVDTTGAIDLNSSLASVNAVKILASNASGGVDIDAGSSGIVTIGTASAASVSVGRSAGQLGFFGTTPASRQTGYTTFANLSTVRTLDADNTTLGEVADVLGTLIEDLKTLGLISA